MQQKYYTQEDLSVYMIKHSVTVTEAHAALQQTGLTYKITKTAKYSPYYTDDEVATLAKERNISPTSAKAYLRRNFKGKVKQTHPGSVYYTEEEVIEFMANTGKPRRFAISALRYRVLNPTATENTIPILRNRNTLSEEEIIVYMYRAGLDRDAAILCMIYEHPLLSDYEIENWIFENKKWRLISHNE